MSEQQVLVARFIHNRISPFDPVLTVTSCPPFDGRLMLNGVISAWLLPRLLKPPLAGKTISEDVLYQYIVDAEPNHSDIFAIAKLATPPARAKEE